MVVKLPYIEKRCNVLCDSSSFRIDRKNGMNSSAYHVHRFTERSLAVPKKLLGLYETTTLVDWTILIQMEE